MEEKAKAYDEAVSKSIEFYNICKKCGAKDTADFLEEIFPELVESEDEQSRNWILEYLYDGLRRTDEQFKGEFRAAIEWLEKQGKKEVDPRYENLEELLDADNIYQMSMNDEMVKEAKSKAINALSELEISKLIFEKN